MLRNYLKIAFRNLLRHKAFSFINICGLAIGMACTILILLWVQDEVSYDQFHTKAERIYRITASLPEMDVHAAVTSTPIAEAIRSELPQIQQTVRLRDNSALLQVDETMFDEKEGLYVDSTFLDIFSFPLLEGGRGTALDNPQSIVITHDLAKKYFGDVDPLGKTMRKDHKDDFMVTGVLDNIPDNSHLQFDYIIPMSYLARTESDLIENRWDNFNYYTYVLMDEHFDPDTRLTLESRIQEIYKAHEDQLKVAFQLQPLSDIHLSSQLLIADVSSHGNMQYVYILVVIAIFILVVACINFMNLATARSARRAKEVGLRKVSGAGRVQLVGQFLAESSLVSVVALVVATALVLITLPAFNDLAGKHLTLNLLDNRLIAGLLVITIVAGLFSGSYPALFLSSFLPVKVLKGNLKAGNSWFRNTLVVVQFVVSIALIVGTAVVYRQLNFIKTRDLGYDKSNLLYVRMNGDLWDKYHTFRSQLEEHTLTGNFAFVGDLPTNLLNATVGVEWEGKDPASQPLFSNMAIDENFFKTFKVELLAGRGFTQERFKADSVNLIVNEKTLEIMDMHVEDAVGKRLKLWDNWGVIIGVVKNFNFKPIQQPIEPLILREDTWGGICVVRTKPGQTEATIAAMRGIWEELNPNYPFSFDFVDQDLANMYKAETRLGTLFNVFATLAIFISCLGLYGLSAFLAERRTKEIGVRKVLGASVANVVYMLTGSFTRPVLVAMLIAAPLAWYGMSRWLEGFAYHVNFDWTVLAIAFVIALLISWLTVSYESIKAAVSNPVDSLRDE